MELSNFLANIWGLSFIVAGLSFLIYPKNIQKVIEAAENEATAFFMGIGTFVIGLAMVLSYNIWVYDWRVVITIFGWLSLIKGASLLLWPNFVINYSKRVGEARWLSYALVVMVLLGCVLIYFGFTA